VDNVSDGAAFAMIEAGADPRIQVIANAVNRGFTRTTNQGLRAACRDGAELPCR
jgi:GT2 family glycosyltransferase